MDVQKVAEWLKEYILKDDSGSISQYDAVNAIQEKFGNKYVYDGESGNLCISKNVLKEFGKIKGKDIVWDRSEKAWNKEID